MPTKRLYQNDSYLRSFSATVLSCEPAKNGWEIMLDQTAFYPEGGGQPADHGTLGDAQVLDVKNRGEEILHLTDTPLIPGSTVIGVLDFARRFDHMQQHSGEHLVSGLLHDAYGFENVGFHLGTEAVVIDISGPLGNEALEEVERAANEVVFADLPITVTYPDAQALQALAYRSKIEIEGQVRIVTIPTADTCACCGTHVARTGEIGLIKLCGAQSYKGGTRITMLSGRRAVAFAMREHQQVAAISALLSAKQPDIVSAVERLQQSEAAARQALGCRTAELLNYRAAAYAGERCPLVFEEALAPDDLRRYALRLLESGAEQCGVFSAKQNGFQYAVATAETQDLRAFGLALNKALNGRGGGKPPLLQGSVSATRKQIEAFWNEGAQL